MTNRTDHPPDSGELRRLAEARIGAEGLPAEGLAPEEAARLIYELRVHQIELEMQNDELRLSQARLEDSRSSYADLYDFAPVGYLTLDQAGRIVEANLTAATLLGLERTRLLNRFFATFLVEADRPVFRQLLNKGQNHKERRGEVRLTNGHNDSRVMLLDILFLKDAEGQERHRVTMTDVTALKRVQEELRRHKEELEELVNARTAELISVNEQLREARDNLEALFDAAPLAIAEFDAEGNVTNINPAAERLYGWSLEEVQGRLPLSIPQESPEESLALLQRVLQGESVTGLEIKQQRKDGTLLNGSVSAAPLYDANGRLRGFIGLAEDITRRKEAEEARRTQSLVLKNMAEGVAVTDRSGHIVHTNPAFDAMFGYEPGELIGLPSHILNAIPPEENLPVLREILHRINTTGAWRGEFRNRKKDGTPVFTYAHISVLKMDGKKLYISVQEDITARRRAQETMRRQAELLDLAHDAILALNPRGRISYWNQGAEALYGWTKGQALGRPAQELLGTRFPEPLIDIERRVLEQGHWEGELVHTTRDGRAVTVNSHWTVKRDEAGRVVAILEINQDITAQKLVEQEVHRLASFPLLNPNPVLEVDEDGGVIYANPAARRVAGDLELKAGVKGLVPEDLKEYFVRARQGGPHEYALEVRVNETAYLVTLHLSHDLPTARLYFVDITARQQAEAAIIQAKEEWEHTFNAVPDAIFILDREHRVLRMNKSMAGFLAKPPEEVIGYPCFKLAHGLDEVPDFCPHARVMVTGEATSAVVEEDGRFFDVAVSPIFAPDGTLLGGVHVARDITARHLMEEALRESEERLRLAQTAAQVGVWDWQVKERTLDFTPELDVLYGLKPGTIKNYQDWTRLVHPEDLLRVEADRDEAIAQHRPFDVEFRILHASGETRWLQARGGAYYDEDGSPARIFGINIDITSRKMLEEALREGEEDLNRAQAVAHTGSWRLDVQENELTWSEETHRIFGIPPKTSMTYETFLGAVHPDDREYVDQKWTAAMRGEPYDIEHRIVVDGAVKWVRERAELEFNQAGELLGGFGTAQDITERKEAEAALRESQRRASFLADLIESSSQPFGVGRLDGDIEFFNAAYLNLLGYSREEFQQLDWARDLTAPEWREKEQAILAELLSTGQPVRYEKEYFRKDGSRVPVELLVHLRRDEEGRPSLYYAFITDITLRRQAEEEQRLTISLLNLVNSPSNVKGLMAAVTRLLKEWSGCEAVGVRLRQGEDFPYGETNGFPAAFVQLENSLCARDPAGKLRRDSRGNPVLECMCGNVIRGRINPDLPFFTPGGSFWTNSTAELLAATSEGDRQARTRNRCHGEGYESVALVPLTSGNQALGLLQFNDRRRGKFTPAMIQLLERLADNLASGIARRQAEESLRESEERYRSLFENNHAVMLLVDPEAGIVVDANPAACTYYGYPRAGLIGRPIASINTLNREQITAGMQQAKDGLRKHFEFKHRLASGVTRDVEVFSGPIKLAGRQLLYSIVHDVTARKEAEAALKESEARFRTLFDSMTEGVALHEVVYDDQGKALNYRLLAINPAFTAHTGLDAQEIEGKQATEAYGTGEAPYLERFARVAQTGIPEVFETYFAPLKRHFAISATSPGPGQFVTVFEDITDRKRMEEDLRRSNQRLDLMAETAGGLLAAVAPQEVVDTLCRKVMEFLDCDLFFNFLVTGDPKRLHLNAYAGITEEEARPLEWLEYGIAVCGCAAMEGCPIVCSDIQHTPDPRTDLVKSMGVQAYACNPLVVEGRVLGTLSFGSRRRTAFTPDDLALMKAVADQVAIAMDRKLAEESLRQSEEALRLAHHDLERQVEGRTAALRHANQQLLLEINHRAKIERELRDSEARFTAFMEHLSGLATMRDVEGRYLFANRAWEETLGLAPGAWRGKTMAEIWPPKQAAALTKLDQDIFSSGKPTEQVEKMELADGPHYYLTHRFPIHDANGLPYMAGTVAIDITAREQAERQVAETGRLYRVLSQVNEAILRARDQQSLFDQICRIAVVEGLFRLAWVGLTDPLDQVIRVAAKYGNDDGYLDKLEIPLADGPQSQGPTGTAVREERYDICNDFATDPRMAPWRQKALKRGFLSSGAFPLRIGDQVAGAITLYAPRTQFFTHQEIALMTSLADNLSFALTSLDLEAKRRQAEAALADHAKLVHDLYNQAPCAYHSLDRDGTYVQINDTELAWLGYTREEVVGRLKFADLLTPDSKKLFRESYPETKKRGWVKDLEYDLVRKDGSVFPVLLSATTITDPAGNFLMTRSTMFDVTERKQAEEDLATERRRLLDLLEHLPAYIYLQAPDHTLRFANREFRQRFGDPNGKACYSLFWGKNEPCPDCPTFAVFRTGQPLQWELATPDGRIYEVYDYPYADVDGSPLVLEMGIDITQRKKAEEARSRLIEILEATPDFVGIADYHGKLQYLNRAGRAMVGIGADEDISRLKVLDLHPKKTAQLIMETGAPAAVREGVWQGTELTLRHRDGREIPVSQVILAHQDQSGRVQFFSTVARDISNIKEAQASILRHTAIVNGINRIFKEALISRTEEELGQTCLTVAEELTRSKFGFIDEINQEGLLDSIAISYLGWEVCKIPGTEKLVPPKNLHIRGIYRPCLREGRPEIVNDPSSHPDHVGVPDGHPPIEAFMGVPLKWGGTTIGMIGLGNKEGGYNPADQEAMENLAPAIVEALMHRRAEGALKASESKLRYLADQLLTAQESERKRLAAELHDELGHALLALKLHLSQVEKKMLPEQEDLKKDLRSQLDYINEVIQEVRRLYHDLSPGDVEDLGLTKALTALINDFAGHVPRTDWRVELSDLEGLFSLPVQTIIYRLIQEALTNIGKHANCTVVTISSQKEQDRVRFTVMDNGAGFDPEKLNSRAGRGVGLVAMEERLNMIGGSFAIESREQEGTTLSFTIPALPEGGKP